VGKTLNFKTKEGKRRERNKNREIEIVLERAIGSNIWLLLPL